MQAVILCGGQGQRMRDIPGFTAKSLVEVGGRPLLWHLLSIYKAYGIREFVLCLGYGGSHIKEYFLDLKWKEGDFHLERGGKIRFCRPPEEWDIIFADTGAETMTGGRIKRIKSYIEADEFMLTYGDGLADIRLDDLLTFHRRQGKLATVTAVRHRSSYGILDVKDGLAAAFQEKPLLEGWINAGFYVLKRQVFDYIGGDGCIFEEEPLKRLVREQQLAVYQHRGYWQGVDTAKDVELLREGWLQGRRPWVVW
jgi:glucose-1-phosphate cytidylyltransferase